MDDSGNPESGLQRRAQPENQGESPVDQVLQGVRELLCYFRERLLMGWPVRNWAAQQGVSAGLTC